MDRGYTTEAWVLTIGTVPGYELSGKQAMDVGELSEQYRACAEQVFRESGIYVSAVVEENRMLYRSEWGCPDGGERGYTLHGSRNPLFADAEAYRNALLRLVRLLKTELKQSAVYLEIRPITLYYLTEDEGNGKTNE